MCINKLVFHIVILFTPSALATEYTFRHSSGYLIKIITPEDKTLFQAVELSCSVEITISSDNPEQEQIPSEEASAFISGLLADIDHLSGWQGQGQGQIVCSLCTILQPASQLQRLNAKPTAISSTPSQASLNCASKKPLLCSFPDCGLHFANHYQRRKHHRGHLDQSILTALANNEKMYCPYCKTFFTYLLNAYLGHISKRHR